MVEYYPNSFQSTPGGSFGNFDHINVSGCKLASVGPRKLIKKINYFILSIGMRFDYSNISFIFDWIEICASSRQAKKNTYFPKTVDITAKYLMP